MIKYTCLLMLVVTLLQGCETTMPTDYRAFAKHMPRSIVVLPPINESAEAAASDAFLSTVTRLLAEDGYYVFPVALVDQHMKSNGVTIPGEMHGISPNKFKEIYGADAVLYIHIKEWTTTYVVIDSTTKVTMSYRLTDTETGEDIWHQNATYAYSSSQGQSNIIGMAIAATVHAIASAGNGMEKDVAVYANNVAFNDVNTGLLKGRRHPNYEQNQLALQEKIKAYEQWANEQVE